METGLQIIENPKFGKVRLQMIDGDPWFCGKDVCEILGYAKPRNAIATHVSEDDALKQGVIDNLGREQEMTFINESGLYSLIFGSTLPIAKEFKRWVTFEVLPEVKEHTITKPDGVVQITRTTKVTGKGQVYFINHFLNKQGEGLLLKEA